MITDDDIRIVTTLEKFHRDQINNKDYIQL